MADAEFTAGNMIAGKYRIESVIGEGGMGAVLAAVDVQLERPVAIKVLLAEHLSNADVRARFLREARAAVKIHSEHVARVYEVGNLPSGAPFMVMERLRGADLESVLENEGPLQISDAVFFVLQACEAIAEAHVAGIIHRDLKPANLFLTRLPDGSSKIKVLDFGISKNTAPDATHAHNLSLTQTSTILGSPLYMSPEQIRTPKDVDARTDIWSLACILFELLAGEPPFPAETLAELTAKVLFEKPGALRERRADIPEALAAVIERALSKDLDERYATIAEFSIALVEFAPKRARAHVERIAGIFRESGTLDRPIQLPPSVVPIRDTEENLQATAPGLGSTKPQEEPPRRATTLALAAVAAFAVGTSIGIVALSGSNVAPPAHSAPVALAAAAPAAAPEEPTEATDSEVEQREGPALQPPVPTPVVRREFAAAAAVTAAPRALKPTTARKPARPSARSERSAPAGTASSATAIPGLRDRFGGRQ